MKIHLPDDIAELLEKRWGDVPHHVIETLAVEGYREGILSTHQIQRMLGFESRFEVDAFLRERRVPIPYDEQDLEDDAEALRELPTTRSR